MSPKLEESIKKIIPGIISIEDYYGTCAMFPHTLRIILKKDRTFKFKKFKVSFFDYGPTPIEKEYKWSIDQVPLNNQTIVCLYKSQIVYDY